MNYAFCFQFYIWLLLFSGSHCLLRCYTCRSRGELGTCGDPFPFNFTHPGIKKETCQSGWCSKMIQGSTGTYRTDDYGVATQRLCLKEGPSDSEERCGNTMVNNKKVYMCFCRGDLCNLAHRLSAFSLTMVLTLLVSAYNGIQ